MTGQSDEGGIRWLWAPIRMWWCWRMRSCPARLCCCPGLSCDWASWKGACCSWREGPSQFCRRWAVGWTGHRCAGLCSLARPAGSGRSLRVSAQAQLHSRAPNAAAAAVGNTVSMRDGKDISNMPKRKVCVCVCVHVHVCEKENSWMNRPVVAPHLFSVRFLSAGSSASPAVLSEFHPTGKRKKQTKVVGRRKKKQLKVFEKSGWKSSFWIKKMVGIYTAWL